jgi:hypothetical protein
VKPIPAPQTPLYRLYNSRKDDFFNTTSTVAARNHEADGYTLKTLGYVYSFASRGHGRVLSTDTGAAYLFDDYATPTSPQVDKERVYLVYRPGDTFFSVNLGEIGSYEAAGWSYRLVGYLGRL